MIDESSYWKRELFRIAFNLRRRQKQRRWPDPSLARVELDVMLGCYIIRKFLEARKVSDSIAKHRLRLQVYRAIGKRVTYLNAHRSPQLPGLDQMAAGSPNGRRTTEGRAASSGDRRLTPAKLTRRHLRRAGRLDRKTLSSNLMLM